MIVDDDGLQLFRKWMIGMAVFFCVMSSAALNFKPMFIMCHQIPMGEVFQLLVQV